MSKERLLLVGAGGFGRMVAEQAMLQYDCAFVDDGQPIGPEVCGIPVVGGLADLPELRKVYGLLVVGIGNNRFRAQVYEKAKALDYAFPNIIAPSAYISPYAKLGVKRDVASQCRVERHRSEEQLRCTPHPAIRSRRRRCDCPCRARTLPTEAPARLPRAQEDSLRGESRGSPERRARAACGWGGRKPG